MVFRHSSLAAALFLAVPPSAADAQTTDTPPAVQKRNLTGLTADEAEALINKLQEAQAKLRNRESLYFDLLSGAPASYQMTSIPPREAFLSVSFEESGSVERVPTDNKLWKPYRLTIQREPRGLVWDVEVVLGFYDQVERVEMFQRPPHPF